MPQVNNTPKHGEILPQNRSIALVAVGSNAISAWGDAAQTCRISLHLAAERLGVIRATSRLYRTPAFPAGSGPDFVNAGFCLETALGPQELLTQLHEIEQASGRTRRKRWGQRTLDLDLIAMDDLVVPDRETYQKWAGLPFDAQVEQAPDQLVLPHPRMHERAFVLVPLADVAPDWTHPVIGLTIAQICAGLPKPMRDEIIPL